MIIIPGGETSPKNDYRWETYKWMKQGKSEWSSITKYTVKDGMTEGIWYQKAPTDSTGFEFVGGTNKYLLIKDLMKKYYIANKNEMNGHR